MTSSGNVAEIHGIFQFTDDFYNESEQNQKKREQNENDILITEYSPRSLYPKWYFKEPFMSTADMHSFDLHIYKFQADSLYFEGKYEECLEVAKKVCSKVAEMEQSGQRVPNIREILEIQVHCLLKLSRLDEAVRLLNENLASIEVTDPGICALRVKVYMQDLNRFANECKNWVDAFLALRPEDEYMLQVLERIKFFGQQ